jgi:hypothetical protein
MAGYCDLLRIPDIGFRHSFSGIACGVLGRGVRDTHGHLSLPVDPTRGLSALRRITCTVFCSIMMMALLGIFFLLGGGVQAGRL